MLRINLYRPVVMMIVLLVPSAAVRATVFTDATTFDAANPGLPVLDFEGFAPIFDFVPVPDFSAQGVTFTDAVGDNSGVLVSSASFLGTPSDFLAQGFDNLPLVMHFAPDVSAAGFNVAIAPGGGEATVDVFNGATLLDTVIFTTASEAAFTTFIGFSDLGNITRIQITPGAPPPGGSFLTLVDNLAFGVVPEPAGLSLLAVGAVLGIRRRRTRC